MNKRYLSIGAAVLLLIGGSYALTYDPQPTTHNGLVRIPTGDADIDARNALEDAKNAFKLHEEARMNGEFDRASYYQEAAEKAISIGEQASFKATNELLNESTDEVSKATDELDELEREYEEAMEAVDFAPPNNYRPDPAIINGMKNAVEINEMLCKTQGINCEAAKLFRKQYEDKLIGN